MTSSRARNLCVAVAVIVLVLIVPAAFAQQDAADEDLSGYRELTPQEIQDLASRGELHTGGYFQRGKKWYVKPKKELRQRSWQKLPDMPLRPSITAEQRQRINDTLAPGLPPGVTDPRAWFDSLDAENWDHVQQYMEWYRNNPYSGAYNPRPDLLKKYREYLAARAGAARDALKWMLFPYYVAVLPLIIIGAVGSGALAFLVSLLLRIPAVLRGAYRLMVKLMERLLSWLQAMGPNVVQIVERIQKSISYLAQAFTRAGIAGFLQELLVQFFIWGPIVLPFLTRLPLWVRVLVCALAAAGILTYRDRIAEFIRRWFARFFPGLADAGDGEHRSPLAFAASLTIMALFFSSCDGPGITLVEPTHPPAVIKPVSPLPVVPVLDLEASRRWAEGLRFQDGVMPARRVTEGPAPGHLTGVVETVRDGGRRPVAAERAMSESTPISAPLWNERAYADEVVGEPEQDTPAPEVATTNEKADEVSDAGSAVPLPPIAAPVQSREVCGDGADNDGDRMIDDADADCYSPVRETERTVREQRETQWRGR